MKTVLSAQLVGANPRKDRTMTLRFVSQELDSEEKVVLMDLMQEQGWLLFSTNEIQEDEIPTGSSPVDIKSHSKRLRNTLFIVWRQKYQDKYPAFDVFYRSRMDGIIDQFKEMID